MTANSTLGLAVMYCSARVDVSETLGLLRVCRPLQRRMRG